MKEIGSYLSLYPNKQLNKLKSKFKLSNEAVYLLSEFGSYYTLPFKILKKRTKYLLNNFGK